MTWLVRRFLLLALVGWMLVPLARHVESTISSFGLLGYWRGLTDQERLRSTRNPTIHWVDAVDSRMADGECVLVFRQADYGFYGRKCYFNYLDEKLIPLYLAASFDAIRQVLGEKRIRYVFVPAYQLPELYNSLLESFLADPAQARLVWDLDQWRLFRIDADPQESKRIRRTLLQFGDAQPLLDPSGKPTSILAARRARPFADELSTGESLSFPYRPGAPSLHRWCQATLGTPRLRGFEVTVKGLGYLYAVVLNGAMYFDNDAVTRYGIQMVWDGVVNGERTLRGQYLVHPGHCDPFTVKFSLAGRGTVSILRGEFFEYSEWQPEPETFEREHALARGWRISGEGRYQGGWQWGLRSDGVLYSESHPNLFARVMLASPITSPVGENAPGATAPPGVKATLLVVNARLAGKGDLRIFALAHVSRHATALGRAESDPLRLIKQQKFNEQEWTLAKNARRLVRAASGRAFSTGLQIDDVDEVRLLSGHMQEIRRHLLFEGELGDIERVLELPLVVEADNRIQIEFAPRPLDYSGKHSAFRMRDLEIVAGQGVDRRVIYRANNE
jgi:hypothetical protein